MPNTRPNSFYRVGNAKGELSDNLTSEQVHQEAEKHRKSIEPWLSAIFQSEHLSLLVGSGFSTSLCMLSGAQAATMTPASFECPWKDAIDIYSETLANNAQRGRPNIEDRLRAALQLAAGLEIINDPNLPVLRDAINNVLKSFLNSIVQAEATFKSAVEYTVEGEYAKNILVSFLLSFASRAASRERLNIFTTNYDRFIEYGCDDAGIHILDRFIGQLSPVYRSSRLELDLHYNPPGIRSEPRFLEGVVRLTKLHGSVDWCSDKKMIRRYQLPFGAAADHPSVPSDPMSTLMIYPNAAKDWETSGYPYADLFRDFSASLCRPNSVLVTYGYGFGDDHINRVIRDMLSIPSTHLVIIAYSDSDGRIARFYEGVGRVAQISLLIGNHFANIEDLVTYYLPKPAIDLITQRHAKLLEVRGEPRQSSGASNALVYENESEGNS